jgi:hypothetical protein
VPGYPVFYYSKTSLRIPNYPVSFKGQIPKWYERMNENQITNKSFISSNGFTGKQVNNYDGEYLREVDSCSAGQEIRCP